MWKIARSAFLPTVPALVGALLAPVLQAADAPAIEVTGATRELRANILSHVGQINEPCDASRVRLQRLLPRIREQVRDAARALGYYKSTFEVDFAAGNECWILNIGVMPGMPVALDEIRIDIRGGPETREVFAELVEEVPLVPGARLNQGLYEQVKNNLSTRAVENGFFSARFERSEIRLDLISNTADIVIDFNPGERFVFGDIDIDAGDALTDDFLRRIVPFEPGTPYSIDNLVELRENLDESRYFSQISITPELAQAEDRQVPLNIGLTMRPRHSYSAGIGFTTDTGPRVRLDYENRYINRRGHQLNGDSALSPVRADVNLNYRLPLRDPVNESIDFGTGFVREDTATFVSRRFLIEAAYRRESERGWTRNLFVNYQQDDYLLGTEQATRVLSMVGVNLSKTRADDLIYPTMGWRLFSELRGASDDLLSDVTFLQAYVSAKGVLSVGDRGRFITRLEGGSTWVDDVQDLPVSVRFFAGGDQSVRGYQYQTLGPLNEFGEVAGGKHLLVGSVEYDFSFRENWRLAVFFDSGNAFNDPGNWERQDSLGFGVRWLSPIGPIRADIAHGFDSKDTIRLHVTMGPDL